MNTIHCRVKQNEYQDIGRKHVTPAEALVIRAIHDPAGHRFAAQATTPEETAKYWAVIVNPVAADVAMTHVEDEEGKATGQSHKRTNAEELARLRRAYPTRSRTNAKEHIVDELFPGLNPQLPETFEEIGLMVAAPDAPKAAPRKGHGPELATVTDDERAVKYDAAPKAKSGKAKSGKAGSATGDADGAAE